jgi:hypothetical protein
MDWQNLDIHPDSLNSSLMGKEASTTRGMVGSVVGLGMYDANFHASLGLGHCQTKKSSFLFKPEEKPTGLGPAGNAARNLVGAGLLTGGVLSLPAALPMLRLYGKGILAKGTSSKYYQELMKHPLVRGSELGQKTNQFFQDMGKIPPAEFVANYTLAARRAGDMPFFKSQILKKMNEAEKAGDPLADFSRGHYNRFMSGSQREGMKHWTWEVLEGKKHNWLESQAKFHKMPFDSYKKLPEGPADIVGPDGVLQTRGWWKPPKRHQDVIDAEKKIHNDQITYDADGKVLDVQPGLFDKLMHQGKTEHEAILELGQSSDPKIQRLFAALAAHNQGASERYGRYALASPALAVAGAGTLASPLITDRVRTPELLAWKAKTLGFLEKMKNNFDFSH